MGQKNTLLALVQSPPAPEKMLGYVRLPLGELFSLLFGAGLQCTVALAQLLCFQQLPAGVHDSECADKKNPQKQNRKAKKLSRAAE